MVFNERNNSVEETKPQINTEESRENSEKLRVLCG